MIKYFILSSFFNILQFAENENINENGEEELDYGGTDERRSPAFGDCIKGSNKFLLVKEKDVPMASYKDVTYMCITYVVI